MRLRIDLGYDGTGFHGWARQQGLRTVQGDLEQALDTVLPWLSEQRLMELAGEAVELYCWDRLGSDN